MCIRDSFGTRAAEGPQLDGGIQNDHIKLCTRQIELERLRADEVDALVGRAVISPLLPVELEGVAKAKMCIRDRPKTPCSPARWKIWIRRRTIRRGAIGAPITSPRSIRTATTGPIPLWGCRTIMDIDIATATAAPSRPICRTGSA